MAEASTIVTVVCHCGWHYFLKNIANVIVYIDDLLVHSASHQEHIATLNKVLQRLVTHNIKINLQKCVF